MQIKLYDVTDQGETLRCVCDHSECFPDDREEQQRALHELRNAGRYWTGGGASPLSLLMRAE